MLVRLLAAFFIACAPLSAAEEFWQKVTWTTPDGVVLVGLYHPAQRPGAYTWVLLHGLGSTKEEWDGFSKKLAAQGNGTLLYDMRGHGASIHTTNGQTLSYKNWNSAGPGTPWDMMSRDVATAIPMLQKQYHLPENQIA